MSFPISDCIETQRRCRSPDANLCAQLAPLDRFGPGAAGIAIVEGLRALFGRDPLGRDPTGRGGR